MGQMADDIIEGACCALCGQYFIETQPVPSVCKECAEESISSDYEGYAVSTSDTH